jgi:hypothetical protein
MSDPTFSPQEIFAALHRQGVDYVAIGGFAANAYGSRRLTLDVDIIPAPEGENYQRLAAALDELGAPESLKVSTAATPYEDLRRRAVEVEVRGTPIRIASLDDLIAMKRASGRPQDLRDIAELAELDEQQGM